MRVRFLSPKAISEISDLRFLEALDALLTKPESTRLLRVHDGATLATRTRHGLELTAEAVEYLSAEALAVRIDPYSRPESAARPDNATRGPAESGVFPTWPRTDGACVRGETEQGRGENQRGRR